MRIYILHKWESSINLEEVKSYLTADFDAVVKRLYENHMALNAGKCNFNFQRFSNEEQQRTKDTRVYYR